MKSKVSRFEIRLLHSHKLKIKILKHNFLIRVTLSTIRVCFNMNPNGQKFHRVNCDIHSKSCFRYASSRYSGQQSSVREQIAYSNVSEGKNLKNSWANKMAELRDKAVATIATFQSRYGFRPLSRVLTNRLYNGHSYLSLNV